MIDLRKKPGEKILELGGGANRHPAADTNADSRQVDGVDVVVDFNRGLPFQTESYDHVYSHFLLEHVSWRKIPHLLREVFFILKKGGMVVFAIPNTEEQIKWIQNNPAGWDGKNPFESMSCVLYGDQDYPENSHRAYFDPAIARQLFHDAGFEDIVVHPYGARNTDMVVVARRRSGNAIAPDVEGTPKSDKMSDIIVGPPDVGVLNRVLEDKKKLAIDVIETALGNAEQKIDCMLKTVEQVNIKVGMKMTELIAVKESMERASLFDKHYFNGGGKVGGYAREGYWDFPVHEVTARYVLARKPESVLELGCARGYVLKRIQDAGVVGGGMEISKHCWLTRVCEGIGLADLCITPWVIPDHSTQVRTDIKYDLCYSVATLEHVPEEAIPAVIKEISRTSKRGLHGIDFGHNDDGFDKTHTTLRPKEWWVSMFKKYAPNYPVEIVDKEELEKGEFPQEVLVGDGKLKLNVGSATVMYHNGWTNIDVNDLSPWAQHYGYKFQRHDVRNGLPYGTGVIDLIHCSHFLEHLTYKEGLQFLRECRRVLRSSGYMRIAVPDAKLLTACYHTMGIYFDDFGEINDGFAAAKTDAQRLWSLLHEGHSSCYDYETIEAVLADAGFAPKPVPFRKSYSEQILKETLDMFPCLSLYVDAVPV